MYGKYSSLYAKWCECYDPLEIEISTLQKYCKLYNQTILDVGCGTGRFLLRVLPIAKKVYGIDYDEDSIKELRQILQKKYSQYVEKVCIYCDDIVNFCEKRNSIDIVVFSWSFYALNEEQMIQGLININTMLKEGGKVIILQPIGGEFENIMRKFFKEHSDMDEYAICINLMDKVMSNSFIQVAEDCIVSEFLIDNLDMFCEALKMFAITEGEGDEKELNSITPQNICKLIEKYKRADGYHFSDEVGVYIFQKKEEG